MPVCAWAGFCLGHSPAVDRHHCDNEQEREKRQRACVPHDLAGRAEPAANGVQLLLADVARYSRPSEHLLASEAFRC